MSTPRVGDFFRFIGGVYDRKYLSVDPDQRTIDVPIMTRHESLLEDIGLPNVQTYQRCLLSTGELVYWEQKELERFFGNDPVET